MSNVSNIVKTIQDIMRKDAGVDGDAQRISQLVWMIFLKVFDDHESQKEMMEEMASYKLLLYQRHLFPYQQKQLPIYLGVLH